MTRRGFESTLEDVPLQRLWPGVYCLGEADDAMRLRGLDFRCGTRVAACLHTAAAIHGFDVEEPAGLHVLSPPGSRLRSTDGLKVHRREGAPLTIVDGRPVTAPGWTAVEVARSQRRARALATLDAALRSGSVNRSELWRAGSEQAGRRGIIAVRDLIALECSAPGVGVRGSHRQAAASLSRFLSDRKMSTGRGVSGDRHGRRRLRAGPRGDSARRTGTDVARWASS